MKRSFATAPLAALAVAAFGFIAPEPAAAEWKCSAIDKQIGNCTAQTERDMNRSSQGNAREDLKDARGDYAEERAEAREQRIETEQRIAEAGRKLERDEKKAYAEYRVSRRTNEREAKRKLDAELYEAREKHRKEVADARGDLREERREAREAKRDLEKARRQN